MFADKFYYHYLFIILCSNSIPLSAQDNIPETFEGDAIIDGQKVQLKRHKDEQNRIVAEGSVIDGKPVKPFESLNIPQVSDISFLPTTVKIIKGSQDFQSVMSGTAVIFGESLPGTLEVKKPLTGSMDIPIYPMTLKVKAKSDWKLSDGISKLKGTFFDEITLKNLYFVISNTTSNTEEITDAAGKKSEITYKKGMNFLAETVLTGALAPIAKLTNTAGEAIAIFGSWTPMPYALILNAYIPGTIDIKFAQLGKLTLELAARQEQPPSIALLSSVIATSGGDKLEFTVRIQIAPDKAILAGTMAGVWDKPFGIKGLQIGNVAMQANFLVPPVVPPLPAITGSLCVGGEMVKSERLCGQGEPAGEALCKNGFGACMAIKLPDLLAGQMDKLTLADIIKLAASITGQKLDASSLPEIGFKEVKIYIVPKKTAIGEFEFERGFSVTGQTDLLGVHTLMGVSIIPDLFEGGIKLQGSIEPIDFQNLLKITGKGGKGKAQINGEITLRRVGLLIDGEINLANFFKTAAKLEVSKSGVMFDFEDSMGNAVYIDPTTGQKQPLLLSHVTGKSSGPIANPQFTINITFKQYLKKYITEQTLNGLKVAEKKVSEGINSAQVEIDKVNNATKAISEKMRDAREKLASAQRALTSIQGARQQVKDKIAGAQRDVDSIRSDINTIDNWYKGLPDVC